MTFGNYFQPIWNNSSKDFRETSRIYDVDCEDDDDDDDAYQW